MNGRPYRQINYQRALDLHAQGHSWGDVARLMGVHRNTLNRIRDDHARKTEEVTMKKCGGGCARTLLLHNFSVDNSRRDGRNPLCRDCVRTRWRKSNYSPCVDCGGPRMSVTRGQCQRCYRMAALLKRTEHDALALIPSMIAQAQIDLIEQMKTTAHLSSGERLNILLDKVTNGNARTVTTES